MKKLKTILWLLSATALGNAQEQKTINPFESVIIEMVCDCNPNQVLKTIVTDANGGANFIVPKDANYSFKIVVPPVLAENGIKMADLANDVVLNFKGSKIVENLSFNRKGVAAAEKLPQGNYEMALSAKPPKGGPNEPSGPPRGKCPAGETPWLGGCIPIVVVGKVEQDNWAICCRQGNKACCDMAPKPSIEESALTKTVDINCPSGKYDANGNCIFNEPKTLIQEKTKVTLGGNLGYHFGGGQSDVNTPFMFLKNGQSVGLDLTLIPETGSTRYKFAVDYFTGTNDNAAIADYVKNSKIAYDSFSLSKSKPSGVSVMVSPQFMLFPKSTNKKLPLMWLDLKAGVMISNQQSLQFFLDSNTPSTEIKTKAMSFVYSPSLVVNVASIKGMFINVRAGYSNYGGFGLGINITEQDCHNVYCFRCHGAGCLPY